MRIRFVCIGKTTDQQIKSLYEGYIKRLSHYGKVSIDYLELKKKNVRSEVLKTEEGNLILSKVDSSANLILLDELGKEFNSIGFSKFLQKGMNASSREMVFVIGGAFGFSEAVYKRANHKIALSKMTFTHQMVRLIFLEQLYRGFTILKGEKYHHN
jgi:23S rRNA (pseudouridine1915-N3)-methyltransferase